MDRRTFSKYAVSGLGLPMLGLSACGGGTDAPTDTSALSTDTHSTLQAASALSEAPVQGPVVYKGQGVPNPTGMGIGFWETFGYQALTLRHMGRRPSARAGFDKWEALEPQKGIYRLEDVGRVYSLTHQFGEDVMVSVNLSDKIPKHYAQDITNDTTRGAAKDFLRAYVQHLLKNFGAVTLTIDYEMVSNLKLYAPGSQPKAQAWCQWYVEAAQTARRAAADMGAAHLLKLQPIFNGDVLPFPDADPSMVNPLSLGGDANPWFRDVTRVSDQLALDTYFKSRRPSVSDAQNTLDIIEFWMREYAQPGQAIVVTENGFSSVGTPYDPYTCQSNQGCLVDERKLRGTEDEQALYYEELLPLLQKENRPEGRLRNRLRSFHAWAIVDNKVAYEKSEGKDIEHFYFGLMRLEPVKDDLAEKPAAPVVRQAIQRLESHAFHRPYHIEIQTDRDLEARLRLEKEPVPLNFKGGCDFEFLRWEGHTPTTSSHATLSLTLDNPNNDAHVLICVNGQWLHGAPDALPALTPAMQWGSLNTIDVYVTAAIYPSRQSVRSLKVSFA